ncbi:MAG: hypothetical protein WC441_04860 [Patescibacteria group bacterium]
MKKLFILFLFLLMFLPLFAVNEIEIGYESGHTLYTTVRRSSDTYIWNVAVGGWRPAMDANVTDYDIACSDANMDSYFCDFPVGITNAGVYTVRGYLQNGASPATSDILIAGPSEIVWSGTVEITNYTMWAEANSTDSNMTNIYNIVKSGGTGDPNKIWDIVKDANGNITLTQADVAAVHVHAGTIESYTDPNNFLTGQETADIFVTTWDDNSVMGAVIVADTNELQQEWANGGRLDLILDSIASDSNDMQEDYLTLYNRIYDMWLGQGTGGN